MDHAYQTDLRIFGCIYLILSDLLQISTNFIEQQTKTMTFDTVEINLLEDWTNILKDELESQGYNTTGLNDEKIGILYFSSKMRLISTKPRNVLLSDGFICPQELQDGLELLKQKIINGENIRPNQSRFLKKLNVKDGLLFDWDIHHLHLGTTIESDGFINRTGPLLYVRFDENNAYFLNVENHGAWTMQELLRIIHRNWPESIENFRVEGAVALSTNFSDEDLKNLRNAQVNSLIEVESGAIYIGPGWGIVASGDSGKAVMDYLDYVRALKKLEKKIKDDAVIFLTPVFKNLDFITNTNLNFKLEKQNDIFLLNEVNNDFQFFLAR